MAEYSKRLTFPFDILWVAEKCGLLNGPVKQNGSEISVRCPLPGCNDTKAHLGINLKKNNWKCLKCGESGGMISLYAKLGESVELDVSTATKRLYKLWNDEHAINSVDVEKRDTERKQRLKEAIKEAPKEVVAPIERRDTAYRSLLRYLSLNEEHTENLLSRGLTLEDIERFQFKSLEVKGNFQIKVSDKIDTTDVAGFYSKNGKRFVNTDSEGITIPYLDINGKIAMIELRMFGCKMRYQRFSSGKQTLKNGRTDCTKSPTAIHHIGIDLKKPPERVYLTEGALKAYVAHALSGDPFIALPGVNNPVGLREALIELKEIGVKTIVLAFDMDLYTNVNVQKGLKNAKALIKEAGLQIRMLSWNPKYKGIDDFYYAIKKKEIVS